MIDEARASCVMARRQDAGTGAASPYLVADRSFRLALRRGGVSAPNAWLAKQFSSSFRRMYQSRHIMRKVGLQFAVCSLRPRSLIFEAGKVGLVEAAFSRTSPFSSGIASSILALHQAA